MNTRTPRSVDEAIARFDAISARLDGHAPMRPTGRVMQTANRVGNRIGTMAGAIMALIAATIGFGLSVGPIGIGGLFLVAAAVVVMLLLFSFWPEKRVKTVPYSDSLPNRAVVQQLGGMIERQRVALPAPAARKLDAIHAQLPLLESRLGELDTLDPLAQDARRLMGKHLPELIERYERVPAAYRRERDGEGMTVDERLVSGLDAAEKALGDIGKSLTRGDLDAFETQGRFIESRYRDGGPATPK